MSGKINYWVSWRHDYSHGPFTLNTPWWISGTSYNEGETPKNSICAALKANSEEEAKEMVFASYDVRPKSIDFRFCESRPNEWSPFNSRFQKVEWMEW